VHCCRPLRKDTVAWPSFAAWLKRQFSAGNFSHFGDFDVKSAVSEAFTAVRYDPGAATDGHWILHDLAVQQSDPRTRVGIPTSTESFPTTQELSDEWAHCATAAEVATRLWNRHRIVLTGFDQPGVSVESAREVGRAVDVVRTEAPQVNLREVRTDELESGLSAKTDALDEGDVAVVMNRLYLTDRLLLQHNWGEMSGAGFFVGPADRPEFSLLIHEAAGHGLDVAGNHEARVAAFERLERYQDSVGVPAGEDERRQWLAGELSGYSVGSNRRIDIVEALAEACAAVLHYQGNASAIAHMLHQELIRAADRNSITEDELED
jgi:hypothetical protein